MIIGNSMGAAIGAGVAARRPELVEALVLVDPALPWGRLGPSDLLRLARMARLAPLMMPSLGRRAVAHACTHGRSGTARRSHARHLHRGSFTARPERAPQLVHLAAERYAYPEAPGAYADAARSFFRELASGAADRDLAAGEPEVSGTGRARRRGSPGGAIAPAPPSTASRRSTSRCSRASAMPRSSRSRSAWSKWSSPGWMRGWGHVWGRHNRRVGQRSRPPR